MIAKIIAVVILIIMLILLMYGAIIGIRENDNSYAVLCSTGAGLIGLLTGVVLGSLLF